MGPTGAAAQPAATVSGHVTDAASGETLLHASVFVPSTGIGAATNNAGFYMISGLAPGTYTFAASYIGYRTVHRQVTLAPGEALRLDFALQPEGVEGEEVVVTAERIDEEERTRLGAVQMATRLVTQLPAVFEADVFRSLQLLPGIKASSDYSSGLYIRGGSPDQTLILLDGVPVYNPTHFFGLFSTFNPDALKDVQVYKGSYPASYGGRLGSVLDIYNKDGNREQLRGSLTLGLLASRAAIEGPYSRGSWMLAVRRSTLEPLLAALREHEEGVPDAFYFYDVNAKLNFDASPNDRLSLAFYSGADQARVTPLTDLELALPYGNRAGSLTWRHLFSRRFFSSFSVAASQFHSRPVARVAGTVDDQRNEVTDVFFKADVEYVPGSRHALKAGVWVGDLALRTRMRFDGEETFGLRTRAAHAAAYVEETWRPTARWKLQGGLRLNAFVEGDYLRLEPRASAEYQPAERLRLQAAYGRYYQYLTLVMNELFSGLDFWLVSAEGVPPAWGDQFSLGLKTVPRDGYRLDAEVYYRSMEDLFELDPFLQDPAGVPYPQLFRYGDGYAYGAELMLEKASGRLTGFVGYTYGHTRRRFAGANQGRFYPPKYDRTHDVNAVLNYDLSRRWCATLSFSYATGQAYTRPLGRTQYDDPYTVGGQDHVVAGRINASRLPAYHRLDLALARHGRFFNLADYELQLQAINVYNRRNVWVYFYDFDDNPVSRDAVNMLPILPNVSFTLNF